ncbi:hypothetical protein G3578_13860 [Brevibacillus sp. SYP-B805]|uniref:hypothetical protein n=1 Tax=Brevibacillus sp. SYP-B805 TaxID=1578199 RepID=UPI0013ED59DD|nr:hypothetical protein [Brevibacillus sp. SYP-B805]NGQ96247.1 hypothetical protein [Brevibacillus sp. SYP-B805]
MDAAKKSKIVVLACLLVPMVIAMISYVSSREANQEQVQEIREMIAARGGTIEQIEVVPPDQSPFDRSGKGNTIYKITYHKNGKTMTAWYRALNQSSIVREAPAWKFD